MATLEDLFAVNGQDDEQEPWCAANGCEAIDIRGEDLVILCADGVARWTNTQREWTEVDTDSLRRTAEDIYHSGRGGNRAKAAQFIGWMGRFWDVPDDVMAALFGED